jgi:hypothetical protein
MFQIGGAELYLHKYLGPKNPTPEDATAAMPHYDEVKETNIQDLLFLENRDRSYDSSIYHIRGVYNVADIDFNLSQFGLFIDNDTVFMTVHINDFIKTIGRKPLSGDVLEIPNLRDEFALNDFDVSLPKYYVISDVGRAAEGFSPTWYPHLYRLKLTKISNTQQFADIFNQTIPDPVTGEATTTTLADLLSTHNRALQINNALISQAEADAPLSGYETQHLYTLAVDDEGNASLQTVDDMNIDATASTIQATDPITGALLFDTGGNPIYQGLTASAVDSKPKRDGYVGYLLGDGIAPNGAAFGHGITFPNGPVDGDYFLRTDFLPNRLFRYATNRWIKREDAVRTSMTPSATRNTQKGTFINNDRRTGIDLLDSDIAYITSETIVTHADFVPGMFAEAALADSPFRNTQSVIDIGGKAAITLPSGIAIGSMVDWRLYRTSAAERVALSNALRMLKKPGTDL